MPSLEVYKKYEDDKLVPVLKMTSMIYAVIYFSLCLAWSLFCQDGVGGGRLGLKHALMCVSTSEGNGSFFGFKGMK